MQELKLNQEIYKLTVKSEVFREGGSPSEQVSNFLVGQAMGGEEARLMAKQAATAFGVPVVPFAGVAAPLEGLPSFSPAWPCFVQSKALDLQNYPKSTASVARR